MRFTGVLGSADSRLGNIVLGRAPSAIYQPYALPQAPQQQALVAQ